MKVAICAICRLENKYIREWVAYYKNLGIDHIYLYDNNDENSERLSHVLLDYLNEGYVSITEIFGRQGLESKGCQTGIYNECFNLHRYEYDWFGFFDIDEFVCIPNRTLHEFLSDNKFYDTDVIHMSWQIYGDCGHTFYENKPVQERFNTPCPIDAIYAQKFPENSWVKSFVKCASKVTQIHPHSAYTTGICRTADGILTDCTKRQEVVISWNNAFVKHYITKSLQEHIERRIFFLNNVFCHIPTTVDLQLRCYFNINSYTKEKIELLRQMYNIIGAK